MGQFHEKAEALLQEGSCDMERILRLLTRRSRQLFQRDEVYEKRLYEFMRTVWGGGYFAEGDVVKDHLEEIRKLYL